MTHHQKHQLTITLGVMVTFGISFLIPNAAIACGIISTFTNLWWIWGE